MSASSHEIVLLRHGKAEKIIHGSDFERDLTETGRERTKIIANNMLEQMFVPDRIISSSAKRALATATTVCNVLSISPDIIEKRTDLYEANENSLLTIIQQQPESVMRILLVGHNPAFEYLAEQLVNNIEDDIYLSPSSMVRLALNSQWSSIAIGQCQLISITHAQDLVL